MYSYDRTKTAASFDLRGDWVNIVHRHEREENAELEALLKKAVPYLKSVGYDLDLNRSYLGKDVRSSDPTRMSGVLFITEREENTVQAKDAAGVKKWVESALGLYGYPKKHSEGPQKGRDGQPLTTWQVDIDES